MKAPIITKASGLQVPFDVNKLRQSLHQSNADQDTINEVLTEVQKQFYHGMSTQKIYQIAFGLLKKKPKPFAAKYKLRRAIMELGPSGFPFERYVAEILKHQGYSVKLGEILKGHCVNHEIDIIAEKENQYLMIECKFHNQISYTCNVKIPLYIKARFQDLEQNEDNNSLPPKKMIQGWLITNTKFSSDAIKYGLCAGLQLVGWDYPRNNSLSAQVDAAGLYPLTCLTSLTQNEKQLLLDKKIVLCRELQNNPSLISNTSMSESRKKHILDEVNFLSKTYQP
ncbi:MAG: ATP cone domain-containing protein [Sphingobacteriaceae bacterium]